MAHRNTAHNAKGGKERAKRLTKEQRSNIARQGAMMRWAAEGKAQPMIAKYGTPDRPLTIGHIQIPCYVLADGTRVLAQTGLLSGIGMSTGGGKGGERKIVQIMERLAEAGVDTKGIIARANSPIRFIPPHGGNPAEGYEATILPDVCAVFIDAGRAGVLGKRLEHLAERAAFLQHGFATIGIISLVDEATGYQDYRARDALAVILEKFVAKDVQPYLKTFPPQYYQEIFRLNGWEYSEGCGRPGIVGHWTNNIVYKRLAPGVWEELKRLTPRTSKGQLKHKLFQRLTDEVGHPQLLKHLEGVLMLMKYAPTWEVFIQRLDKEYPQWGETMPLPFLEE
jgi:hypothetical protein